MQRFSLPQLKLPVCLCLAFLAAPAPADEPARKPIDPNTGFARLTGQVVQTGTSEGFGNGFVIGRMGCHVLTNFHVAFGKSKNLSTGEVQFVDALAAELGRQMALHL